MDQLRVLICRVDEEDKGKMTELASYEIPKIEVGEIEAETRLDELETNTQRVGQEIVRKL